MRETRLICRPKRLEPWSTPLTSTAIRIDIAVAMRFYDAIVRCRTLNRATAFQRYAPTFNKIAIRGELIADRWLSLTALIIVMVLYRENRMKDQSQQHQQHQIEQFVFVCHIKLPLPLKGASQ